MRRDVALIKGWGHGHGVKACDLRFAIISSVCLLWRRNRKIASLTPILIY